MAPRSGPLPPGGLAAAARSAYRARRRSHSPVPGARDLHPPSV